jgi:hypothetical protein
MQSVTFVLRLRMRSRDNAGLAREPRGFKARHADQGLSRGRDAEG